MNVATRGTSYISADGGDIALPLARWSGHDVWCYLASHDLPWLRIYDVGFAGRIRERGEFTFAAGAGDAIRRHGAWESWKSAYPEAFAKWAERWPEMAALA